MDRPPVAVHERMAGVYELSRAQALPGGRRWPGRHAGPK